MRKNKFRISEAVDTARAHGNRSRDMKTLTIQTAGIQLNHGKGSSETSTKHCKPDRKIRAVNVHMSSLTEGNVPPEDQTADFVESPITG